MKNLLHLALFSVLALFLISCETYPHKAQRTEVLEIPTADVLGVRSRTHNAHLTLAGQAQRPELFQVTAELTARGQTEEEAAANLALLSPTVDLDQGTLVLGKEFTGPKGVPVAIAFDITGPRDLDVNFQTHNGHVRVSDIEGDVSVKTHNGHVELQGVAGPAVLRSHNGNLAAKGSFAKLEARTHNGGIRVENGAPGATHSLLKTHNGRIGLVLSAEASLTIHGRTHNGSIQLPEAASVQSSSKSRMEASLGGGEGKLEISTHNGSIHVEQAGG